ncbi:MAG TPA: hypothetical protein VHB79_06465 [Polyangiaceae bacterium]|nr:hypothetical protein [Polyangiaceae bacterium]
MSRVIPRQPLVRRLAQRRVTALSISALALVGCGQPAAGGDPSSGGLREAGGTADSASAGSVSPTGGAMASGGIAVGAGASSGARNGGATSAGGVASAGSAGAAGGGSAEPCAKWYEGAAPASQWVYRDEQGTLAYKSLNGQGDRILDFSYAGYRGGGVALPHVPAGRTLTPSGGDDTGAIQAALDAVSRSSLVDGTRGAVELSAGTFRLSGSLHIAASGVVLRGAGSGLDGSVLKVEGEPRTIITLTGSGKRVTTGSPAKIVDAYAAAGTKTLHVDDAAGLNVGDEVLVQRPVTAAWIHFMGMDKLVRNGAPQTWLAPGSLALSERKLAAISGNQITIEPGLSDSLDAKYLDPPAASLVHFSYPGRISTVGVEGLRVTAPPASVPINQPTYSLLSADAVIDGWVDDVHGDGFTNGLVVGAGSRRMTVRKVELVHTAPIDGAAGYPADFVCSGQQILFVGCASEGERVFSFVTQALVTGPNVVFDLKAKGSTSVMPHQRWATGLLVDNLESPDGSVQLINRKTAGSGHGWAIGWGVVWNAQIASLTIQQPPGAQNWAIGSTGAKASSSDGLFDSPGVAVKPSSLYLAQLCQRLGPEALAAIGYQ